MGSWQPRQLEIHYHQKAVLTALWSAVPAGGWHPRGHSRCLWGTDFPIANGRGKAFSLGNTFQWLYERDLETIKAPGAWPMIIETMMALRQAAILAELTPAQVEDVLYNNAMRLFHGK